MISKPGRSIPITLGEPVSGGSRDFIGCPPVTFVHVAADPEWTRDAVAFPRHNGETYSALIDTGFNRIAIRPDLAVAIGARSNGLGIAYGIGEPQPGVKRAAIQIIFPAPNFVFAVPDAAILELPGDSRSFDLILGRQFLKRCRLLVDGPNSCYRLDFLG